MKEIEKIRSEINKVDKKILMHLKERLLLADKIAQFKKETGKEIYQPSREEEILRKVGKEFSGWQIQAVEEIFRTIISTCRGAQKTLSISYLGPECTFTHQAAEKVFGKFCKYTPALSIRDVFEDVETHRSDYGVVPVENSTEGMVSTTLDLFVSSPLKIVNEVFLPIIHCLVSREKDIKKIKKIYSHASALAQCRDFLSEFFPLAEKYEMPSTAAAVKKAKNEPHSAAIAGEFAAKFYSLNILKKNIEDSSENYTRFFVLSPNAAEKTKKAKTSILFSVKDKPGALHNALAAFKKKNINLTKIESRPSKRKPWEYLFFVDFLGHISEKKVKEAMEECKKHCLEFKILGSYPGGKRD